MHAMSLDDVYHVDRVLAQGAGGVTELVSIEGAGPFVRKKLPVEIANQGVWSAIGTLDCRRLPKVEATYSLPDQFVVVYDYVPGQTLEELVTAHGHLGSAEAASLAGDICEAASALHSCGIIHRDLSPRNVIVAADGAHLVDLGIARMRVEGATRDTTSLGTHGFASPEQYGFAQTDARSDVYAIGKLLGYMLTGLQPDGEEYEARLADAAMVDAGLASVVRRACAFEPSARYQTAEQMAAALGEAAGVSAGRRAASHGADIGAGTSAASAEAAPSSKKPKVNVANVLVAVGIAALLAAVVLTVRLALGAGSGSSGAAGAGASSTSSDSGASTTSTPTTTSAPTASSANSSSNVATAPDGDGEELPLEIVESGWSAGSYGYIHFALGVRNSSENTAYELVGIKVVGYNEEGKVLFSEDQGIMACLPGQTTYYASQAGGGTAPSRVEFTLQKSLATLSRRMTDELEMTVTDLSISEQIGLTNFVCMYSVRGSDEALASVSSYMNMTAAIVVLRDDAGNIVYGTNAFASSLELGEGQTIQVTATDLPPYATAEAYVMPW